MSVKLTTSDDPAAIPYFLWDAPITNAQLRQRLSTSSEKEKARLIGKIMRQARDSDVWRYTTPHEVLLLWPQIKPVLGRRLSFWEFLFDKWQREGLLDPKQTK